MNILHLLTMGEKVIYNVFHVLYTIVLFMLFLSEKETSQSYF